MAAGVLAVGAAAGGLLAAGPTAYQASGTALIAPPWVLPDGLTPAYGQSELAVAAMTSMVLMSTHGQQQVRPAPAVRFQVAQVNLGSLQSPNFRDPGVTVTVTAPTAAQARDTFQRITQVLSLDLAAEQAQAGAPATDRMTVRLVSGMTLQDQRGSAVRMYAALAALTLLALCCAMARARRRPASLRDSIPGR